jgi:hypothetical protein
MMCAVYFVFAKTFNDPNFEPYLRPVPDSPVNAYLKIRLVSLMNFIASAIVTVIMIVILNAADAVPVSIEAIIYIAIAVFCQCVGVVSNNCNGCRSSASTVPTTTDVAGQPTDVDTGTIGSEDGINEMTALLKDIDLVSVRLYGVGQSTTELVSDRRSTMTKADIVTAMESKPRQFCFIRCLSANDQEAFKDEYLNVLNVEDASQLLCFQEGCIEVSTWLDMMKRIECHLECHYCVYRDAYFGENTGKQDVSPIRGSYKAMLAEFGREHIRTFDLLIANQHISSMVVFRRSSFVNVKQWFWDTCIGRFIHE